MNFGDVYNVPELLAWKYVGYINEVQVYFIFIYLLLLFPSFCTIIKSGNK